MTLDSATTAVGTAVACFWLVYDSFLSPSLSFLCRLSVGLIGWPVLSCVGYLPAVVQLQWKRDYGGKKGGKNAASRPLAFDCCALSLAPFEVSVYRNGVYVSWAERHCLRGGFALLFVVIFLRVS